MVAKFRWLLLKLRNPPQALVSFCSTVLLTGLTVTGAITVIRHLGGLEAAELDAYDRLIQARPDEDIDDRFLVVGVTEDDIQRRQEYPLHDQTVADLLAALRRYEPRAIALDIARDIPQGEGREALLREFAASDRIIAGCTLSSETEPGVPPLPGVSPEQVGFADFPVDAGGIVRRSILISTPAPTENPPLSDHLCSKVDPENQLLSFGLIMALIYLEDEGIPVQQTNVGYLQLGSVVLPPIDENAGGYRNNGAIDYQLMLNYRSARNAIPTVSLTNILQGDIDPSLVKDRLVFIGYFSTVANDYFFTPYSRLRQDTLSTPGVIIHAQSTSQLLSAVLDRRPIIWYVPTPVEVLWILLWAITSGAIGFYMRQIWRFALAEAIVSGLLILVCYSIFLAGGWMPLIPALLAALITASITVLLDRANQGGYSQALYAQAKEAIQGAFRLSVKVDQAKKEQQVAEITESTFFKDLARRAKEIREQREQREQQKG